MKLTDLIIDERMSIKDAIKKIDETARKILIVTSGMKLKGTVTDGDIRRWILKNGDLQSDVAFIMNPSPKFVLEADRDKAKMMLQEKMIEALPVVNAAGDIVDIVFWNDNFQHKMNYYNKLD